MAKPLLVALVSAKGGQEAEFDEWYEVHMDEVRAVPGIATWQRYRVGANQAPGMPAPDHANLALYELDGDPADVLAEIVRRRAEGEWTPRRGIDETRIGMWVFEPVTPRGEPIG